MSISLLVCGGRKFDDKARLFNALDYLHQERNIALLIHGSAPGADSLAEEWAKLRQIDYRGYPAKWNQHGTKLAGPLRNRHMIKNQIVDAVMAFPGGSGTADMIKVAQDHFVSVLLG